MRGLFILPAPSRSRVLLLSCQIYRNNRRPNPHASQFHLKAIQTHLPVPAITFRHCPSDYNQPVPFFSNSASRYQENFKFFSDRYELPRCPHISSKPLLLSLS